METIIRRDQNQHRNRHNRPASIPLRTTRALIVAVIVAGVATASSAQVSGIVTDLALTPLEGALVSVQAGDAWTLSAPDGTFTMPDATGSDLVVVTALKGYLNASRSISSPASSLAIAMRAVPQDDDPAYILAEPTDCGGCHPNQLAEWTDSPMAKAGINTWVHDIYNGTGTAGGLGGFVYTRDSAFAPTNPNSECSSCHQPQAWLEDPFSALEPKESLSAGVVHGVSCDVCHKVADIDISQPNYPGLFPGIVTVTRPQGPDFDQVQYGVLGDSDFESISLMRPSYQPQLVAEVCAACHQDKNDPDEDGEFEEPNGVISEPTYLEWADSPYGDIESPLYATCVDCHMAPAGTLEVCDLIDPPLPRDPDTVRSHTILGTTPYYLENAAELAMSTEIIGDAVHVAVDVNNSLTGHHVPTGVTVRNMILLIEAWRDGDDLALNSTGAQVIHDLGGIGDPALGYYAGLPGVFFAKINHNEHGVGPTFFTDAFGLQSDNRIPALATDSTDYTFDVPPGGGTLNVRARLIYRRAFRFLVDAKGWTEDGHGNPLADVLPPHYGHLMESLEQSVVAVDCTGEPVGTSCSDGNPCNGDELCDGADNCAAGTTLVCDDANVCTDNICIHGAGCTFPNNAAGCDDGDACTTEDTCDTGACVGGPPLACDDDNPCTDDSCSPSTGCDASDNSDPCDDENACTTDDTCSAGVCTGGAGTDCSDANACTSDSCNAELGCINSHEPQGTCLTAKRSALRIRSSSDSGRNSIKWRWTNGGAVEHGDFGTPDTTTNYSLCIYDTTFDEGATEAELSVEPGPAWKQRAGSGWKYKDADGVSDGVQRLKLKAGAAGHSRAQLDASGGNTPMPVAATSESMFEQAPAVVVQLVNDSTGSCWKSEFAADGTSRNTPFSFKARDKN